MTIKEALALVDRQVDLIQTSDELRYLCGELELIKHHAMHSYIHRIAQQGIDNCNEVLAMLHSEESDKALELNGLTTRSYTCLCDAGISTVSQLTSMSEADLLKIHNLGKWSLRNIKEALAAKGLTLNDNKRSCSLRLRRDLPHRA